MNRQEFRAFLLAHGCQVKLPHPVEEISFDRFLDRHIRVKDVDVARRFFSPFVVQAAGEAGYREATALCFRALPAETDIFVCPRAMIEKGLPDVETTIRGLMGAFRAWRWRFVNPLELVHVLMRGHMTSSAASSPSNLTSFVAVLPHASRQDDVYMFERPTLVSSLRHLHAFKVEDMCCVQRDARPSLLYLAPAD